MVRPNSRRVLQPMGIRKLRGGNSKKTQRRESLFADQIVQKAIGHVYMSRSPWCLQCQMFATIAPVQLANLWIDCFTVSLHSPNGRLLPAVRAVQRDCQWYLKNGGNSNRSRQSSMPCNWCIPQHIFWSANHKRVMLVIWKSQGPRPTVSPTATKRGLCNSLIFERNPEYRENTWDLVSHFKAM